MSAPPQAMSADAYETAADLITAGRLLTHAPDVGRDIIIDRLRQRFPNPLALRRVVALATRYAHADRPHVEPARHDLSNACPPQIFRWP